MPESQSKWVPVYRPYWRLGERGARRFREAVGLFGVAAPVVYLAWQRGGVDATEQAVVFVWVLAVASGYVKKVLQKEQKGVKMFPWR